MATSSVIQRSFAAGELAPSLHARADLARYLAGARTLKNFIVRKEGGISNRAGFRYVATVKNSAEAILMRFVSGELGESVLIEMGDGYFRFYQNGELVELDNVVAWSGATAYVIGDIASRLGVNYYCIVAHTNQQPPNATYWYAMPESILEIPHGFGAHQPIWDQQGNVITLTSGDVAPTELIYASLTRWVVRTIATGPWTTAVAGLAGTVGVAGTRKYRYVVTVAKAETYEETEAPAYVEIVCGEPTPDNPNGLTWTAKTGAVEYYVYLDPFQNGVYGYIGTAGSNSFKDTGLIPDFAVTPPIARVLFNAANEYPCASGTFDQRRVFGRTVNTPDQIDLSRPGFPSNFGISSPLQDDDAIRFKLAGSNAHPVHWLVGLDALVVGTSAGVWRVRSRGDAGTTPSSIDAKQNVYSGTADKKPAVIGRRICYIGARQRSVKEVRLDENAEGLEGKDLGVAANHLFEPSTLFHIDYAEGPHSTLWAIRNDGVLLGLTYVPDEEVQAWHRHDTYNGAFEDLCVIPEADEDVLYVIVRRVINGETVRYIERLETRVIRDDYFNADSFFVDSGLSYAGPGASAFSGLDHLEGQVVAVLADGAVLYDGDPDGDDAAAFTITGGGLTFDSEYQNVHIGLPIRFADVETIDLDVQGSEIRDKPKRIGSVTVLLDRSARGFLAGPDEDHLTADVSQAWEGSEREFTGQVTINLEADFNPYGRVFIRQPNPLPLTILGIIPNGEVGG